MSGGRGSKGKGQLYLWLKDHVGHVGDECLIWPFTRIETGYGTLSFEGKIVKAHRMMCTMAHGEPPEPRYHAAHSCHRGHLGCVHPGHLSWKTPSENTREYVEQNGGTVNHVRRLTLDQIETIRASDKSLIALAAEYGVHKNTIGKIRRGQTWKNPRSSLTREQIERIKELRLAGARTVDIARQVGIKYSVAWKTISNGAYRA